MKQKPTPSNRRLQDLVSVGPATLADLRKLEVHTVTALALCEPEELYQRLCRISGKNLDICCLDTFSAAVAQARDPGLPPHKKIWWYWSRLRKREER